MTYLAYHLSDYNEGKNLPIAAGHTKDAALGLAARNVLRLGWTDGSIFCVKNNDITLDTADKINSVVEDYISGRRVAV